MDKFFQSLSIGHVFRYGFSGFALLLVCTFVFPDKVLELRTKLGDMLTAIIAFAIGGAIYISYRALFDDLLYWLHYGLHYLSGQMFHTDKCKCKDMAEGVKRYDGLNAFRVVRDFAGHNEQIRLQLGRFEVEHSEIHLLYSCAFVLELMACCERVLGGGWTRTCLLLALLGLVLIALGMWRDLKLCGRECAFVRANIKPEKIQEVLQLSGLLDADRQTK